MIADFIERRTADCCDESWPGSRRISARDQAPNPVATGIVTLASMARTDNDTWDLATSVGATATMVAAGRARATRAGLIDDPFAEPLVRAVGIDFFTRWAAGKLHSADVDIPGHPWGMQPMTDLMAARTRFIDTFCADAVAAGIRQVVILASGLDARGYRLAWPAGTTVFEIDQPQVLDFKATTLAALGAEPTVELRAVPIDLRHDWPAALRQAGFETGTPTAWVAEGLLAFLPAEAQDRLLDNITTLSADGSRLVAEIFLNSPESLDVMHTAAQKWYEHGLDAHIDDLWYPGDRRDVAEYLDQRGWRTVRTRSSQLLADNGLPVPPRINSETENYYCTALRSSN
ncbi:putative S-adenosyl-L-methionine-dependent methyltransferase [Mycobacterium heckeshornense]|uniref:S-adenosyl-L-methionine-dependent methyltransferase n=2 Tax=Mycobacterium heckeshornense TaxID=110505 RepID=A0A7R7YSX5_9MYCO|nr:putative S-adenosyl-L-methionine-dependent methyltransferase [Mycobacterium heckeshornense]BCQ10215.1 putative S-adenosyl-L-methionine-dependent methyltransferase [Mycobacterium heckeshornense]